MKDKILEVITNLAKQSPVLVIAMYVAFAAVTNSSIFGVEFPPERWSAVLGSAGVLVLVYIYRQHFNKSGINEKEVKFIQAVMKRAKKKRDQNG